MSPVRRYGTLISVSSRSKRDVYGSEERVSLSKAHVANRINKMKRKWIELNQEHSSRKVNMNGFKSVTFLIRQDLMVNRLLTLP